MYKLVYLGREAPTEIIPNSTRIGPISAYGKHVLREECGVLAEKLRNYEQHAVRIIAPPGQLYWQTAMTLSNLLRQNDIRPLLRPLDRLSRPQGIIDIINKTVEESESSVIMVTTATNIAAYCRHQQDRGCTPSKLNINPGRLLLLNQDL